MIARTNLKPLNLPEKLASGRCFETQPEEGDLSSLLHKLGWVEASCDLVTKVVNALKLRRPGTIRERRYPPYRGVYLTQTALVQANLITSPKALKFQSCP